jgi:hypothetical protein
MREGCAWMMDRLLLGGGMELGWFLLVCAVYGQWLVCVAIASGVV